jgi:hypothetical protein
MAPQGVLKVRTSTAPDVWTRIATGVPPSVNIDAVWVGPGEPSDPGTELWYDTDAPTTGGGVDSDRRVIAGGTPGADAINIFQGHAANDVATDLGGVVVLGGGTAPNNNIGGGDGTATVGTATPNVASLGTGAHYSLVGGYDSVAGGLASIVLGFHNYTAPTSTHGTISGGSFQKVEPGADYATISGGSTNKANGDGSTIGGGTNNETNGAHATVAGGATCKALAQFATAAGGTTNTANNPSSVVSGGGNNNARGDSSAIGGGGTNTLGTVANPTWGTYSLIDGGFSNNLGTTAQANYAVIGGGRANSVQTDFGTVLGGRENVVSTRNFGQASGMGAVADKYGQDARASGYFTVAGDAQTSVLVARRETTDATPAELLLDVAASWRLDMAANTTWAFSALVVARRADVDGENAAYKVEGCIKRDAAAASTLVGTPVVTVIAESTVAWDIAATANASGRLIFTVTGDAAKTIRWVARIQLAEVTG